MPFSIKKSTPYATLYNHKEKKPTMSSIDEMSMFDSETKKPITPKKGGRYISKSSTCNMDHY